MRKLAVALKCQPASIYHYYQTKSDILNDLYLTIHQKYFAIEDMEFETLEDLLFELCSRVQKYRKEYLFIVKYFRSTFLNQENIKMIKDSEKCQKQKMSKFMKGEKDIVTHLLISGPIVQLAFLDGVKLSEDELSRLVRSIVISVKGECLNETTI